MDEDKKTNNLLVDAYLDAKERFLCMEELITDMCKDWWERNKYAIANYDCGKPHCFDSWVYNEREKKFEIKYYILACGEHILKSKSLDVNKITTLSYWKAFCDNFDEYGNILFDDFIWICVNPHKGMFCRKVDEKRYEFICIKNLGTLYYAMNESRGTMLSRLSKLTKPSDWVQGFVDLNCYTISEIERVIENSPYEEIIANAKADKLDEVVQRYTARAIFEQEKNL